MSEVTGIVPALVRVEASRPNVRRSVHSLTASHGPAGLLGQEAPAMTLLEETALRELLASPHGKEYVRAFMQAVEGGAQLNIPMKDGTVHVVTTVPQLREVLTRHFGQHL